MKCAVYQTRSKGAKLPKPVGPVLGVLQVMPFHDGSHGKPVLRAELVSTDGQGLLPVLLHVRVGRVQGAWLTVAGTEHVSKGGSKGMMEHYPQTWWCRVESEWPVVAAPQEEAAAALEPDPDEDVWVSRAANMYMPDL